MSERELKHPDYSAAIVLHNLRLRFQCPGSRFGAVYVVLSPEDAAGLIRAIDAAFTASLAAAAAALGREEERARESDAIVFDLLDWHAAECGCDEPGNPSKCIIDQTLHHTLTLAAKRFAPDGSPAGAGVRPKDPASASRTATGEGEA